MLFNSYIFIFGFLPLALTGFFVSARWGRVPASLWLVLVSFAFYAFWHPPFLAILLVSIAFNYAMSELIGRSEARPRLQTALLTATVSADLGALVYYKYLFSLFQFMRDHGLADIQFDAVALPLGISFFTFTQIGYLIDVKQGVAKDRGLLNYMQFVTFFPHLIARR
jgi:D-alanyl-lipoteichoic acid acyltransferase DltB (MBOAT superfamily)